MEVESQQNDPMGFSGSLEELYQVALAQLDCARAPYSNFRVGAALFSAGHIFPGCNVENSSYGLTLCAERSAVMHWASAGSPGVPEAIVIVARHPNGEPAQAMPCGACRQVLSDLPDSRKLLIFTGEGNEISRITLEELLPHAFGPADLDSGEGVG